jgi:hypothetical protein
MSRRSRSPFILVIDVNDDVVVYGRAILTRVDLVTSGFDPMRKLHLALNIGRSRLLSPLTTATRTQPVCKFSTLPTTKRVGLR